MKRQRVAFTLAIVISLMMSVHALCDVVVLSNGRQMQCDSVAEDEKEVRCKIGQSTMTLARSKVSKILKQPAQQKLTPAQTPVENRKEPERDRIELSQKRTVEGVSLFKKKQYAAAIRSFQEAYDLERNSQTVTNLALAYYHSSNLDNAKTYFAELLLFEPESTLALNGLGFIAAQQGDFSSASDFWRRSYALKRDPAILQNLQLLENRPPEGARGMFTGIDSEQIEKTVAGYDQDSDSHFRIRYDGGSVNPVLLREIAGFLDESYDKLRFGLDVELPSDLEVILYPKKDFLQITGAPDWSGGFNDGRIHLPVGGLDSINSDVERLITHELTHSLLDLKTGGRSPGWLQEGLAQYMDGSRITTSDAQFLSALVSEDTLPSIQSLGASFMTSNSVQARIQYSASLAFTEFLIEKHRFDAIPDFLTRIANGQTIQEASRMAFGSDFSDLESEWHQTLKN